MYLRTEKRTDRRHGTTAILLCLCMTGILFLTAMAIDLGNLMAARRHNSSPAGLSSQGTRCAGGGPKGRSVSS